MLSLERWASEGLERSAALETFEQLPPIEPEELKGAWRGTELPTGHPIDGLLRLYGWWGKRFYDAETVAPLLFQRNDALHAVDPARLPLKLALALPHIARTDASIGLFRLALPLLSTRKSKARLRRVEHSGRASAAMIYDDLPIIDHFRRIDGSRALGLMDLRCTLAPYFFLLTRQDQTDGGPELRP
jgi:hypothetical protein